MPFECRIPVRFGDIDIAKIVYYPRFLHFCHVAMEEMFGHVIGLCHTNQPSSLMYPSFGTCENKNKSSDETAGESALCY